MENKFLLQLVFSSYTSWPLPLVMCNMSCTFFLCNVSITPKLMHLWCCRLRGEFYRMCAGRKRRLLQPCLSCATIIAPNLNYFLKLFTWNVVEQWVKEHRQRLVLQKNQNPKPKMLNWKQKIKTISVQCKEQQDTWEHLNSFENSQVVFFFYIIQVFQKLTPPSGHFCANEPKRWYDNSVWIIHGHVIFLLLFFFWGTIT